MTTPDGTAPRWWATLEEHLAARERDVPKPDPWAEAVLDVPPLTDDQSEFLAGLGDQPAPPRIGTSPGTTPVAAPDGGPETGNSPGDSPGEPGVPSSP